MNRSPGGWRPLRAARRRLAYGAVWLTLGLLTLAQASLAATIEAVTEETSYSFLQGGKVAGVGSEIVEQMLHMAGLDDYHLALYPWARAYDMALLQPNVLIYPIVRTPTRESQFKWIGQLARIAPRFYKLREEHDIVVTQLDDARRYTIGVIRDDVRQQYLEEHDFSRMVVSANNADNFRKLLNHQVQLVVLPEREARVLSEAARIDYDQLESVYSLDDLSSGLYFAYSKSTPDDVVARTRAAFERLKAAGGLVKAGDEPQVTAGKQSP
ncbi:transporter substrate-binding domain-containing protein [Pseudomonas sp. HR96]|uniref:substrate-binding periplasmic protein n=1 Tax=Pseudomonas sp. HR96 TaxID=1027966 RepID=UPI002A75E7E5|nr:transporter substrate-binding domain-containing protein [Pseudomonas sp. HR96]WPP01898.1 transporter substrate-binding domain-containing protein [Pseudomonas sp. HR96]